MKKYFLDTEFIETGNKYPIIPLSIGIVCNDGREYYAVFDNEDKIKFADDWVMENVVKHIDFSMAKSLLDIQNDILDFIVNDERPFQIWGYYSDYDWVVFCGIFGRMIDLPDYFPMYCMDLKQLSVEMGDATLPELPNKVEHHALWDAREIKYRYEWLVNFDFV